MNENNNEKKCIKCKEEIDFNAKVCPYCDTKQGGIPFWVTASCVIGCLFLLGIVLSGVENYDEDILDIPIRSSEKKKIEYTPVDIDELEEALENNAAVAKEKYNGKYFAISGRLGTIDSDLEYISLLSPTDKWDIIGIHCTIKNAKTRKMVKTLVKDQNIIVKGKITDVGEVLGYYLDIDEILEDNEEISSDDNSNNTDNSESSKKEKKDNKNTSNNNSDTSIENSNDNTSTTNTNIHVENSDNSSNESSSISVSKKNALRSAKSYLEFSEFSREGLIHQLEYEKYSNEDAVYAVDNVGANWNEQALKSAKSYLEYSAFSYSGLKKQLEYEKFTSEQATYGVNNCGANWSEQAVKSAKSYLEYSSFSREGLISQLEYEGFTREQAEYGVSQNGL